MFTSEGRGSGARLVAPLQLTERRDAFSGTLLRERASLEQARVFVEEGEGTRAVARVKRTDSGLDQSRLGFQCGRHDGHPWRGHLAVGEGGTSRPSSSSPGDVPGIRRLPGRLGRIGRRA